MNRFGARKYRTLLFGSVANGNHVVELPTEEFADVFGALPADVDPDIFHCNDSLWMKPLGMGSRTENFEPLACQLSQQTFRHLASCRVAGAEKQDCLLTVHSSLRRSECQEHAASETGLSQERRR